MWTLTVSKLPELLSAAAQHSNLGMAIIHLGPWATVSSMCFFVGALVGGDLLALRGALMMAYVFSLINGLTGVPSFPYFNVDGRVNVDMVFWAVMSGCLHGCAVFRMLLDELPVRFSTEDNEQLARFFNRRSGMERLETREALKRGRWMRVSAGQRIVSSVELHEQVYLLVEGKCCFNSACCFPSRFTSGTAAQHYHHHHHHHQHHHHQHGEADESFCFSAKSTATAPGTGSAAAAAATATRTTPAAAAAAAAGPTPASAAGPSSSSPSPEANKPGTKSSPKPSPIKTHMHFSGGSSSMYPPEPSGLVDPPSGSPPLLRSGHVFSLSALNVFGVYIGFDQDHGRHLEVWAETDCLLYCWPMSALEEMATNCSPALASYWRNFVMYSIASEFEHRAHRGAARCSTGEYEQESWLAGARSRDFTDELRPYEKAPSITWVAMKRWLKKAVSPFPPAGIRHTALPTTGAMARTRAMAVADARKQAEQAAKAKQAELEEIAACSICSDLHHLLTPRTAAALRHEREMAAAAMRHEQERAWLESWKGTPAVDDSSIWVGLPAGCAVDQQRQEGLRRQRLMQWEHLQQQHSRSGVAGSSGAGDVTVWMGVPPEGTAPFPEPWQQQQGLYNTLHEASAGGSIWSGLPGELPRRHSYNWEAQQQQLKQAAAAAWFVRAHPIPINANSDEESASGGSPRSALLSTADREVGGQDMA